MIPLVSIIIPTFNRVDLLKETLISVLEQSFNDYEVIIADDGSSDSTYDLVKSFNDDRIVFLQLPHSGIPSVPRNRAIEIARGKYIAFLDSDDLWLPYKLESSLELLKRNSDVALVCSNEYLYNGEKTTELLQKNISHDKIILFNDLIEGNIISSSTVVVHKEVLEEVGKFDESINFRAVEDYHLWLRLNWKYKIYYSNETLGYYRIHNGSIRLDNERSLTNLRNVFLDLLDKKYYQDTDMQKKIAARKKNIELALLKYYVKKYDLISVIGLFKKIKRNLKYENSPHS